MEKGFVYLTTSGAECCAVPLDEVGEMKAHTGRLRTSPLPLFKRIRVLLRENGVDPDGAVLAQLFGDDYALEFGIVVSKDSRVFIFHFDWLNCSLEEGKFRRWEDVTERVESENWKKEMKLALQLIQDYSA